mmetsp:Transcript_9096/g.20368  ORF Transcript_9096/g.20368 Transcript_9096/m.20368 type:complete len:205 (-) Transcript_9096:229-843(-)
MISKIMLSPTSRGARHTMDLATLSCCPLISRLIRTVMLNLRGVAAVSRRTLCLIARYSGAWKSHACTACAHLPTMNGIRPDPPAGHHSPPRPQCGRGGGSSTPSPRQPKLSRLRRGAAEHGRSLRPLRSSETEQLQRRPSQRLTSCNSLRPYPGLRTLGSTGGELSLVAMASSRTCDWTAAGASVKRTRRGMSVRLACVIEMYM